MDAIHRDLKLAIRRILRAPLFSVAAIATIGMAIAVSTGIAAFVDAALFRDFGVEREDRLVSIYLSETNGRSFGRSSWGDLLDLDLATETLTGVAGHQPVVMMIEPAGGSLRQATGTMVSERYFEVLGVPMHIGIGRPTGGISGGVVLEFEYWKTAFGGRTDVLQESIRLDGVLYPITGVAEQGFRGLTAGLGVRFWQLIVPNREGPSASRFLNVVGRQSDGTSMVALEGELQRLSEGLEASLPETNAGLRFIALPLSDVRFGTENGGVVKAFFRLRIGWCLAFECRGVCEPVGILSCPCRWKTGGDRYPHFVRGHEGRSVASGLGGGVGPRCFGNVGRSWDSPPRGPASTRPYLRNHTPRHISGYWPPVSRVCFWDWIVGVGEFRPLALRAVVGIRPVWNV